MQIKQYKDFYYELGRLRGIADVSDGKLSDSLTNIILNLGNLFTSVTIDQATPQKPATAHSVKELGGVKRPMGKEQTPIEKAEEEAFEEVFEK